MRHLRQKTRNLKGEKVSCKQKRTSQKMGKLTVKGRGTGKQAMRKGEMEREGGRCSRRGGDVVGGGGSAASEAKKIEI